MIKNHVSLSQLMHRKKAGQPFPHPTNRLILHNFLPLSDPNLCKILIKCYNEKHTEDIETATMDGSDKNITNVVNNEAQQQSQQTKNDTNASDSNNVDECLLCSEQKRDTVFKPCGHVVACEACGSRIKKCLICRETVSSREKVSWVCGFYEFDCLIIQFSRSMNVSFAQTAKPQFSSSPAVTWLHAITARPS